MNKIGTPPMSVSEWLESFAEDNDEAAKTGWFPWTRANYRARAAAFRMARELVDKAENPTNDPFPVRLEPGESTELHLRLEPKP